MSPVASRGYGAYAEGSVSSSSSQPSTSSSYHDDAACRLRLPESPPPEPRRIKCVFVGDAAVGKTSLIVSYTTNGYPQEYVPTAFDNYSVLVRVDNRPVRLQLCDTAGQDEFKSLRELCYPDSDVFLLCFSVVSPSSFYALAQLWIPEIRASAPLAPVILIGTQADLRSSVRVLLDLRRYGETPVSEAEARAYGREIGAFEYLECSALTQLSLKEVFDAAILVGLHDGPPARTFVQEVKGVKGLQKLRDRLKRTNSLSGDTAHAVGPAFPLSPGLKRKADTAPAQPPFSARPFDNGYQSDTGGSAVMFRRQLSNSRLHEVKALPKPPPHGPQPKISRLKKGWKAFMCLF